MVSFEPLITQAVDYPCQQKYSPQLFKNLLPYSGMVYHSSKPLRYHYSCSPGNGSHLEMDQGSGFYGFRLIIICFVFNVTLSLDLLLGVTRCQVNTSIRWTPRILSKSPSLPHIIHTLPFLSFRAIWERTILCLISAVPSLIMLCTLSLSQEGALPKVYDGLLLILVPHLSFSSSSYLLVAFTYIDKVICFI